MNNHNNIKNMFESWGKGNRKLPTNNAVIKDQILSKVPTNFVKTSYSRPSPFPWPSLVFASMAVLVLIVNLTGNPINSITRIATDSGTTGGSYPSMTVGTPAPEIANQARYDDSYKSSMPYYGGGDVPITDDREFLKTSYNATLRTREVSDTKTKIESIVRGIGGRVDGSSSSEKYGYVSFAIPKDDLEAFRLQIKDLVGARFYEENTNSQNLLPQKQMIEENKKQTENSLSSLKSERQKLVTNHNQTLASFQSQINSRNTEINILNAEYATATADRRLQITNRINQLQVEISNIQSQISGENKSYNSRVYEIDSQIRYTEENLKSIQAQDKNLIASVETVNGSISLSWISLWEMADAYFVGPLLAWILLLGAVVSYFWNRRYVGASASYF